MDLLFKDITPAILPILKNCTLFQEPHLLSTLLSHHGTQVFHTPLKTEVLVRQFEQSHHITLNMGTNNHSLAVTRYVNRFFRRTSPQTPQSQLTNPYEVRRKILPFKTRAAPGEDGSTPLMLRHLSKKPSLLLHKSSITSYGWVISLTPGNELQSSLSPNPINHPRTRTRTDPSVSSA